MFYYLPAVCETLIIIQQLMNITQVPQKPAPVGIHLGLELLASLSGRAGDACKKGAINVQHHLIWAAYNET